MERPGAWAKCVILPTRRMWSSQMKETLYGRNTVLEALRANRRQFYQISLSDGIRPNDVVSPILSACQKRGIRLYKHTLKRYSGSHVMDLKSILIGHSPGNGDIITHIY